MITGTLYGGSIMPCISNIEYSPVKCAVTPPQAQYGVYERGSGGLIDSLQQLFSDFKPWAAGYILAGLITGAF